MSGGENINCPQCRRPSNIEIFEHVKFTATEQWDQLLEIARKFAAMEGQLGPDTSEEEEEEKLWENFIDYGDGEARFVGVARWQGIFDVLIAVIHYSTGSQEHNTTSDGAQEDESVEGEYVPYSQIGKMEKKRRMKELAAEREHKRMRQ